MCLFKLNVKGEGDNIRFAHEELWDDTPEAEKDEVLERALMLLLWDVLATLQHKNLTDLSQVTGANRETPGKYLKGMRGCSFRELTQLTEQLKEQESFISHSHQECKCSEEKWEEQVFKCHMVCGVAIFSISGSSRTFLLNNSTLTWGAIYTIGVNQHNSQRTCVDFTPTGHVAQPVCDF